MSKRDLSRAAKELERQLAEQRAKYGPVTRKLANAVPEHKLVPDEVYKRLIALCRSFGGK